MDRKSVIVLAVCFLLMLSWGPLVNRLYPPLPQTNAVASATNRLPASTSAPAITPPVGSAAAVPSAPSLPPNAPEELLEVQNGDARYIFSSHWGGLKQVELLKYVETVDCREKNKAGNSKPATLNTLAPVPALSLLGGEALTGDGVFQLTRLDASSVRAEKSLPNGLLLVKEFILGTNYLVAVRVRLENRSAEPLALPAQELVLGTATPMGPQDDGSMMGLYSYDGAKAQHITEAWFANRTLGCGPGSPRSEYLSSGGPVVWAAVHNQFFTMVAAPKDPAPQIVARHIDLPPPSTQVATNGRVNLKPVGYQTAFLYPALNLAPNGSVERSFEIFAGPKEYHTLSRLDNRQDLVMDFGGFFGFFSKALLLSMNGLHAFGLPYGLAIVAITLIIKLLFWPLTQASTRSMKRMQLLQPQMKVLQEKYKDDPKKMNAKLMEFMKENKVSPLGGCLPMAIQMPVFIGFFYMIKSAIELRGARFLWVCDLSRPDTLFLIPGFNFPFNPMPLMMGVTMLWQARLTPPSPGADPMQQKLMKYMPLMFLVFLYNFSAALTLYWTVQNLLTIAQMKLTRATAGGAGGATTPAPGARPVMPVTPKKKK